LGKSQYQLIDDALNSISDDLKEILKLVTNPSTKATLVQAIYHLIEPSLEKKALMLLFAVDMVGVLLETATFAELIGCWKHFVQI
jgi:hypothetical protein